MEATVDRKDADKRATEEATVKVVANREAADKRASGEAAMMEAANKEATNKRATVNEASVGAARDSLTPGQVPSSAVGAKMVAMPSSSTPPAKRPYRGVWKSWFV
jgi:hypothetical protein